MENMIRIKVRLKSCTIFAFFAENNENKHLIFCKFHVR